MGPGHKKHPRRMMARFLYDSIGKECRKMRNDSGFTMAELMIVVAVLGVLSAIALTGYVSLRPKFELGGAARQVMGDLMAARMKAVNANNTFKVIFVDTAEYQILDDADNDGVADAGESVQTKNIQEAYSGVTLSSTRDPVFSPKGTVDGATTVTVTNASGSKTVSIALTGRVKIN